MGYSVLMQWSISPTPANLTDILITRLLEHYSLSQHSRTSIHFRTYRATSEHPTTGGQNTRLLTAIVHSQPNSLRDTTGTGQPAPRDDTTYLFLEDRKPGQGEEAATTNTADEPAVAPAPTAAAAAGAGQAQEGDNDLEIDGFAIIDLPPDTPNVQDAAQAGQGSATAGNANGAASPPLIPSAPTAPLHPTSKGKRGTYRILAVRPSSSVLPLLQNLLSPFVVGLTKAARAQASTTAQNATPTPLAGTPFLVTSLTFPPLAPPNPQIVLTVHNLSSAASTTIFVEAELLGEHHPELARAVLLECLGACVPDGLGGTKVFHEWEGGEPGSWEGTERVKRMTLLLAKCLREASYI